MLNHSDIAGIPTHEVAINLTPETALRVIKFLGKSGNMSLDVVLTHFMAANCPDVLALAIERIITPIENPYQVGNVLGNGTYVITEYDPFHKEPYKLGWNNPTERQDEIVSAGRMTHDGIKRWEADAVAQTESNLKAL